MRIFSSSSFRFVVHKIYKSFPIFGTPPEAAGFRTPPFESLILKGFAFVISKIYQCTCFRAFESASRGTPAGFPRPPGGSPSPSKSPPEGGESTPQGAGACRPPVRPLASPSTPLGHPYGVPPAILAGSPSRLCSAMERVGKRSAQGRNAPERGWKKIKVVAPIAAAGRQRWKCGEGGAVGGQGWGQPVGSPRAVHGVSLPLSTDRRSRPPVA